LVVVAQKRAIIAKWQSPCEVISDQLQKIPNYRETNDGIHGRG